MRATPPVIRFGVEDEEGKVHDRVQPVTSWGFVDPEGTERDEAESFEAMASVADTLWTLAHSPGDFVLHSAQIFDPGTEGEERRIRGWMWPSEGEPTPWQTEEPPAMQVRQDDEACSFEVAEEDLGRRCILLQALLHPDGNLDLAVALHGAGRAAPAAGKELIPAKTLPELPPTQAPRQAVSLWVYPSLARGMGPLLDGERFDALPDLSLRGPLATREAKRQLLRSLEDHARKLAEGHTPAVRLEHEPAEKEILCILHGLHTYEVRELWDRVSRDLAGRGTASIRTQAPTITAANQLEDHGVRVQTRLGLAPDRETGTPLAWFTSGNAPIYQTLWRDHGDAPVKADGWVWLKSGSQWDGYRLSTDRIRGNLSTYHCLRPLLGYILAAFWEQRNSWAREELRLSRKLIVKTTPYRVIRLDPRMLAFVMDENGQNWRARVWQHLEVFHALERTTRTETGRIVEAGDRLFHLLIDGHRTKDEKQAPEDEKGLWRILREGRAVPSDAFFAVPSPDFIDRYYPWDFDESGRVYWGARALGRRAKKLKDRAERKKYLREAKRISSSYSQSRQIFALASREGWSPRRELLACRLEMNRTVNVGPDGKPRKNEMGGGYALRQVGGYWYEVCRGTTNKGYYLATWMRQGGYVKQGEQIRAPQFREFLTDLRYLCEHLGIRAQFEKGEGNTGRVLEFLQATRTPPKVAKRKLDLLLPVNLEEIIRRRLQRKKTGDADEVEPAGLAGSPMPEPDKSPGRLDPLDEIQLALAHSGMDQATLAGRLTPPVSRTILNLWLNGKKKLPEKREAQIREILSSWLS